LTASAGLLSLTAAVLRATSIVTDQEAAWIIILIPIALLLGLFVYRAPLRDASNARLSIHLDRGISEHTIDSTLRRFRPSGEILILQTWIPGFDLPFDGPPTRDEKWRECIQDSLVGAPRSQEPSVHMRILLLGSEEVLRNRIRHRADIARAQRASIPMSETVLEHAVEEAKARIDTTATNLLALQKAVKAHIDEHRSEASFQVEIRYYRITPCSPIYIFGSQALLTGFYDHRWTSDRAPAVRLGNPDSAEWVYFKTQFECVWDLTPENGESVTTHTTPYPEWRKP
jgi:hypothetical protein